MIAKLLLTESNAYLALYSRNSRFHIAPPAGINKYAKQCAHIIYGQSPDGKGFSIDLFLIKDNNSYQKAASILKRELNTATITNNVVIEEVKPIARKFSLGRPIIDQATDYDFGITYRIQKYFSYLAEEIKSVARADICDYFKDDANPNKGKAFRKSETVFLEEILQPTILIDTGSAEIKKGTKSLVHGDAEQGGAFCHQHLAIDFFSGCKAYTKLKKLADGSEARLFDPAKGCSYCYNRWVNMQHYAAGYKHANLKSLKRQIAKHKAELAEMEIKAKVLRIGEGTENFLPESIKDVLITIRAANEEGLSVVLPTKTPFYKKEIADEMKNLDVSLLISLGSDKLEKGICGLGFPNKKRIENGLRFRETGVRTGLYPLIDATRHPEEQKVWTAREAYRLNQKTGIPVQFLLFRSKDMMLLDHIIDMKHTRILEASQIGNKSLLISSAETEPAYYLSNSYYVPVAIHPFYPGLVTSQHPTLGACFVLPDKSRDSFCSGCLLPGVKPKMGKQIKKPFPDQEARDERKLARRLRTMKKKFQRAHKNQEKLKF